jgi:diguanylate cyclase (GGDEF)-like protein
VGRIWADDPGDRPLPSGSRLQTLRKSDLVFRIGGDEFALLLPETDAEQAAEAAARVAAALSSEQALPRPLGISFGVALFPDDGATCKELIRRADQALYDAKRSEGDVRFAA